MSNRTQLRARLREELGDTGTVTTWADGLLDDLLIESVGWYSRLFPMPAAAYRDVVAGARSFSVPPGTLQVVQVECPPGRALPEEASGTTGQPQTTGLRQSWSLWGGLVYLGNPASGAEVGTQRLVMRILMPWNRLDPSEQWNGPEDDERLLVLWASARAWEWLDGQERKRGRPPGNVTAAKAYIEQLQCEVATRKSAATSRRLDTA